MENAKHWTTHEFSKGLTCTDTSSMIFIFISPPALIFFCSFTSHLRSSCPWKGFEGRHRLCEGLHVVAERSTGRIARKGRGGGG